MNFKNKLAIFGTLCALFVLIIASQQVIDSAKYALSLCAGLLLPSLFPFFVLSVLLNRLGFPAYLGRLLSPAARRLFHTSGAGASALIIGITGGYPLGAAYIADMTENAVLDPREAEHLLAFCNNSGPAFIIGAIGVGVFHSSAAGLALYAVHILSAILTGMILRGDELPTREQTSAAKCPELSTALPEAIRQSVASALTVCGFVVCFTVFVGVLDSWGLFRSIPSLFLRAAITGILELGSGVGAMQGLPLTPASLALAAGMVGFGGLSVHMQTMAVISGTEIKGTLHVAGRLLDAAISAIAAYIIGMICFRI